VNALRSAEAGLAPAIYEKDTAHFLTCTVVDWMRGNGNESKNHMKSFGYVLKVKELFLVPARHIK
jgi:hypothetical protein